jgi:sensor c-di-GMP phosphodiesterase-like protein
MLVSKAMRSDSIDSPSPITRRGLMSSRPRRPWLLIVAALLLAVLSAVLWAKWEESRVQAERLQAEIKQVYAETEALRTQATRAQQRVMQLERQLREAPPVQAPAAVVRPKNPRPRQ